MTAAELRSSVSDWFGAPLYVGDTVVCFEPAPNAGVPHYWFYTGKILSVRGTVLTIELLPKIAGRYPMERISTTVFKYSYSNYVLASWLSAVDDDLAISVSAEVIVPVGVALSHAEEEEKK